MPAVAGCYQDRIDIRPLQHPVHIAVDLTLLVFVMPVNRPAYDLALFFLHVGDGDKPDVGLF